MKNNNDNQVLKKLIEGKVIQGAKMGEELFNEKEELLKVLENKNPGIGSFVLLEDGGWVEYVCISAGCEYEFGWRYYKRPEL